MSNNRIIKNHTALNEDISIDKYIRHNYKRNSYEYVYEVCDSINSISTTQKNKVMLSLENIIHSIEKEIKYDNSIQYNNILESIIEYHNINKTVEEYELRNIIDKSNIDNKYKYELKDYLNNINIVQSKVDIDNIINKFFVDYKYNIVEYTPNILGYIRKGILISITNTNIFIEAIDTFINKFLEKYINRKDISIMIYIFNTEIDNINKKINNSNNENTKKKYEKYLEKLELNSDKLLDYFDSLYSYKELENLETLDIDDFNINESCDSIDINISNRLIDSINIIINKIIESDNELKSKYNKYYISKDNILQYIKNNIIYYPIIIKYDRESTISYIDYLNNLKKYKIPVDKDIKYSFIYEDSRCNNINYNKPEMYCIYLVIKINNIYNDMMYNTSDDLYNILAQLNILESSIKNVINITNEEEFYKYLVNNMDNINEITSIVSEYIPINIDMMIESCLKLYNTLDSKQDYIYRCDLKKSIFNLNENTNIKSDINTKDIIDVYILLDESTNSKLLGKKISYNIKRGIDKEKQISKLLDNKVEKLRDDISKKITNKNREKVIKGYVLPSASNIIKMALGFGIGYMLNPIITIIGLLTALALSTKSTDKERQYILDEIDIQLEIIKKKKQLAENNNDLKALEELLMLEKKVTRERQRILYKLRHRRF